MGAKNNCAITIEQGYENSKHIFDKVYNDAVTKFPDLKGTSKLVGFMQKGYSENSLIGELFSMWITNNFSEDFFANTTLRASKSTKKEDSDLFLEVNSLIETQYLDLYDNQMMIIQQEFDDGDSTDYNGTEDANSITVNLKHDGEGYFKGRLFSAINEKVSTVELAKISKAARENSFVDFLYYIKDTYPKVSEVVTEQDIPDELVSDLASQLFGETELDIIPNMQTLQKLRYYHIFSRPENQRTKQQKKFYVITNYDQETKTILPEGELRLIDKPAIDLRTKKKLSDFYTASFLDVSSATLPNGKKIGQMTSYMSLNDLVTLKKAKVKPGQDSFWYAVSANFKFNEAQLNQWLKILLRDKGLTIATLRGGNSGTIMLTNVDNSYYNIIFPKEQIKKIESKLPKSFLMTKDSKNKPVNRLEKYNYNFNKAFLDYENKLKNALQSSGVKNLEAFVSDYNQIEDLQRRMAAINYLKYLDAEFAKGNLSETSLKNFKNNIFDLPVETKENETTGMIEPHLLMGEYLASIIARHEWLKAARGNKYATKENVEYIFNRMRMGASEGLVDRNAEPTKVLIYNQSDVYYKNTDTGQRIEPKEKIEGMKNPVDKDDGILHANSEDIDNTTYSIGRQAVMPYEHNPKEIKTVSYHLKQNNEIGEDGVQKEDDYIELKSMKFLAEPNFAVVDKKSGKEILSTSKTMIDGKPFISIIAGPFTDIPGQKIDNFGSLNVAKTLGGKFAIPKGKSFVIGTIPAESTRTIILPGTKSHSEAALGTTWANSFNIDSPVINKLRDLIINEFKSILDRHLNTLHNIRTSPEYARKWLRYQTKVRNDLTDEIKTLYQKTEGFGIHHSMYWDVFKQSIFNSLILDGGMKAKIGIDKANPGKMSKGMSSSVKIKADMMDRIALDSDGNPEGVIVGVNNDRLFNYISDLYLQKVPAKDQDSFKQLMLLEKLPIINNFLSANEILLGNVRQPVQSPGGYVFRNVLSFNEDLGDVVLMHNKDVAYYLIADSDGDTANISIWPNQPVVKEIANLLKDKSLKVLMDTSSDLNIFEPSEKTNPGSYKGFTKTMLSSIQGFGGMGIITNLKTTAGVLELKLGDSVIKLDNGTDFTVIKALDYVTMDYAPLKDSVTEKDIPYFAKIVNKEGDKYDGVGKKYLRTTASHERLILLNAATDNTKEHLIISKWGISYDTVYTRMFKRVDGKEFNKPEIKVLKKLVSNFNYSSRRNGQTAKKDKMDNVDFYRVSKEVYTFINQSEEGRNDHTIGAINLTFPPLKDVRLKEINISDKITVDEMLLSRPYEKFLDDKIIAEKSTKVKSWNGAESNPLEWSETFKKNINLHALYGYVSQEESNNIPGLNSQIQDMINIRNTLSKNIDVSNYANVKQAVKTFANEFDPLWRKALREAKGNKAKFTKSPTVLIYDYNDIMSKFVDSYKSKYNNLIKKHGELADMMLTWHMLDGLGQIENVQLYYPADFIHQQTMTAYMKTHEKLMHAFDNTTGLDLISSDVQISKQIKRNYGDPFDPRNFC